MSPERRTDEWAGRRVGSARRTAREHRVFADLFRLSTYLIPRADLPAIPPEIERRMAFVYASEARPAAE